MARALIIDGTATDTLSQALRQAGLDVEVVGQPEWAEGRVDAARFDLVVTPGSEFARLIERCAEESAQRQTTEVALLDAEAMYRSFAEGLPIHLICKDKTGTFTFANGLFCRELGRTLPEIVGRTDFDFFTPELAEKYRTDDRRVFESRRILQTVEENQLPSGQKRYVEVLKAPVYNANGDVTGVQIAFWDVTDRKRAEEELQESESRHRAILEAALDCIVTIDQEGQIIEFNPAAESAFGYCREDALGRDMLETLFAPAAAGRPREGGDADRDGRGLDSMLGRRLEQTMIRRSGEKFLAETCMQTVPLEGKTVYTLFLRDITARKRAEEEINRKNRDLETLLYVTSHDLREPLRAIHNFAKLVNERYTARLDERGQDFLRRVVRGAERLDRLLEDVLTLSRAQRSVEIAENVPLADVVADVLQQLESRIERTGANVSVAPDLPNLSADRRWVTQAVYNLVANALKFTKPGEAPEVAIAAYHPASVDPPGTGIVVADRGPGVPPGYAERIFQLFQRAVGREVEGTGAGLAIVRQIAERHGGTAWVRPREGGGAEFVVTFDGSEGIHGVA
jgi:PAS domain S-box-containing protein